MTNDPNQSALPRRPRASYTGMPVAILIGLTFSSQAKRRPYKQSPTRPTANGGPKTGASSRAVEVVGAVEADNGDVKLARVADCFTGRVFAWDENVRPIRIATSMPV